MPRTVIIDGEIIELMIWSMSTDTNLLDVSEVGGTWRKHVAKKTSTELEGIARDGRKISGFFKIVEVLPDRTWVLESRPNTPDAIGEE